MSQPKAVREITVLVRNDKGAEYYTTIRPNGVHSCSCPAKKTCYHITQSAKIEAAREAVSEQALAAIEAARKVVAEKELATIALTKEVEAMVAEAENELARDLAPLNGNRPFSLLRR